MSDPDRAPGWSAAFGPLPAEDAPADPSDPDARWARAVALGGRGHYAAASAQLQELISGPDRVIASLAASTLASHRRQLGAHAAARGLDGWALRALAEIDTARVPDRPRPPGADLAAARSDALLGLAADAVGLGRTGEALRLIGIDATSADPGWRGRIRRSWLAAETALGAGDAHAAVAPARAAAAAAEDCPSTRHRIKSGLVLGVALAASGDHAGALETITAVRRGAESTGLLPLVWPSALVLADLDPDGAEGHRRAAGRALHCVLRHSEPAARALAEASPWVPTCLFASAPNR